MSVADCDCEPSLPEFKANLITALTTVKLGFHISCSLNSGLVVGKDDTLAGISGTLAPVP
jgi:hypothetical protein